MVLLVSYAAGVCYHSQALEFLEQHSTPRYHLTLP